MFWKILGEKIWNKKSPAIGYFAIVIVIAIYFCTKLFAGTLTIYSAMNIAYSFAITTLIYPILFYSDEHEFLERQDGWIQLAFCGLILLGCIYFFSFTIPLETPGQNPDQFKEIVIIDDMAYISFSNAWEHPGKLVTPVSNVHISDMKHSTNSMRYSDISCVGYRDDYQIIVINPIVEDLSKLEGLQNNPYSICTGNALR